MAGCSKNINLSEKYKNLSWSDRLTENDITLEKEIQEGDLFASKFKFSEDSSFKLLSVETLKNVDEARAKKLIIAKNILVREIYETQATPYSGSVTKEASCFEGIQLVPTQLENDNQISFHFNLKATERFVTGVCIEEQNVYKNHVLHLYCKKSKELYDIKLFYLKNSPTLSTSAAHCL